jgi:hypothetical protein
MTQKLVCVIDRSKWARKTEGVDKGSSRLLNGEGNSCCLGHLGLACQIPEDQLLWRAGPNHVALSEYIKYPADIDWKTWHAFMNINDDIITTDAQKEAKLMELAQENGFEFQFVGE